jgi:hypothetical protein
MLPQLSFQFYELGLEFNDGVCDNAGCQGCARGWAGRAGGRRIIDVLESPETGAGFQVEVASPTEGSFAPSRPALAGYRAVLDRFMVAQSGRGRATNAVAAQRDPTTIRHCDALAFALALRGRG